VHIPLVAIEDLPEDLQHMVDRWRELEDGDPNFIRALGHAPEMLRRFVPFYSPLVRKGLIEHRTKELVRISIANLNDCRYCQSTRYGSGRRAGIDDTLAARLSDYEHGPFSERERAALRYADAIALDPHDVPDAVVERVRASFSEDERLELTWVICLWLDTGRLFSTLGIEYGEAVPSGLLEV
jgi:uncharacterized peroxidase-related enzyme